MEAILMILGELATPLLGGFAVAAASFLGLLAEGLSSLVGSLLGRSFRRAQRSEGGRAFVLPRVPPAFWRFVRWTCGIVLGALALALLVGNAFWFDANVRWLVERVERSTGTRLRYRSVEGSFWTGRLVFRDLEATRLVPAPFGFDLRIAAVEVDLAVFPALLAQRRFDEVVVRAVRGSCERRSLPHAADGQRPFRIDTLSITDLQVTVADLRDPAAPSRARLELTRAEFAPLRSDHFWFDALFRGNAVGKVDDAAFEIGSAAAGEGRKTRWKVRGLGLAHARPYLPGLARYVRSGTLDLDLDDTWSLAEPVVVHSAWKLVLRDLVPPEDLAALSELEKRFVSLLTRRASELPLQLRIDVLEDSFAVAASIETAPLVATLGSAVLEQLGVAVALSPDDVRAVGRAAGALWKEALEAWRARK